MNVDDDDKVWVAEKKQGKEGERLELIEAGAVGRRTLFLSHASACDLVQKIFPSSV